MTTWQINVETGELIGPRGNVRDTLSGPPYRVPDDAQEWAESNFRSMTMADLDTQTLADFALLWTGNVEATEGSK